MSKHVVTLLNRQKCRKRVYFHKKIYKKRCQNVFFFFFFFFFHSLESKRGLIFHLMDHSDRVLFQRCRAHMFTQGATMCENVFTLNEEM